MALGHTGAAVAATPREASRAAADAQRGDIEGLRAIAVALVIGYHFFPAALSGGYVGVDVFFVISGYLITRSLHHALLSKPSTAVWLCTFWARRARRLLPNALLVLLVTGLTGAALFSEFSIKRLGSDIVWSSAFSVNWLFVLRSIDYLSWDETQKSTLLHFWSLAVEEQFYVAWPLTLLLISGYAARTQRWAVAMLAALSLAWCVVLSASNLTSAFFSTPARAWELLTGVWLAWGLPAMTARRSALAAWSGLTLIAGAAVVFSDDTLHPGIVTVMPVVGCALLIASGGAAGFATRCLSHPALQLVGARSYSIYLWHWPVLVLGGAWASGYGALGSLVLLFGSLALAELAYRLVERPARFRWALTWSCRRVLSAALLAAAMMVAFGFVLRAVGVNDLREMVGLRPAPLAASRLPSLAQVRDDLPVIYRSGCHLGVDAIAAPPCEYGRVGAPESIVLFGDSHAAQWFSAVDQVASARGLSLRVWTKSSCPSADVAIWNAVARSAYRQCDAWRASTLERIEALRPRWVILSNFIETSPPVFDVGSRRPMRGRDAAQAWSDGFERVLRRLAQRGIGVIVIRDVPRPRPDVLDCIYAASDWRRCELGLEEATAIPAIDAAAARRTGAVLWDLSDALCPDRQCVVVRGDTQQPVYRDFNHLTDTEVRRLAPRIDDLWSALPDGAAQRPRR